MPDEDILVPPVQEATAPPPAVHPPHTPPATPHPQPQDSGFDRMIPTRNPPALIGYYLSIASLFPCLGLIVGPIAIWKGVQGRKMVKETPALPGIVHAWIAIVLGSFGILISLLILGIFVAAAINDAALRNESVQSMIRPQTHVLGLFS